ncbi:hypothetical protein M493_16362 [Geobacillus genomosp. 3]|uniref:Uncharacterized protein n=1 Tax=Geobacillus genomosp. 3 TaxID=1921421 RepID=V5LVS9_GEOG3|nr:hypothetical protein M493_16362 [Geobacillus genomosp. 3]
MDMEDNSCILYNIFTFWLVCYVRCDTINIGDRPPFCMDKVEGAMDGLRPGKISAY